MILLSDWSRPPRGPARLDPTNPSGETRQIVTDTWTELDRILELANGRYSKQFAFRIRKSFAPDHSSQYKTRSQPVLNLDESAVKHTPALGVVEIPEAYFKVVVVRLKRDFFLEMHAEEEAKLAGTTLKRPTEEELLRQKAWSHARPTLRQLQKHFQLAERSRLIHLLAAGEWIDEPESYGDDPAQNEMLTRLNADFRMISLGRQEFLQYSSTPGERIKFGKGRPPSTTNPLVAEYLAASPEHQAKMLELHAFLPYLLTKAGAPAPKL